jgi:hypothetical protein
MQKSEQSQNPTQYSNISQQHFSLNHSFDVNLACQYGINEAILIHHFLFWVTYNKRLNRNFRDGRTWMYQTQEEMAASCPYFNRKQVMRTIESLVEQGVIIKGNYNKTNFDRTIWYAFENEKMFSIVQKWTMESPETENGKSESGQPIPDTKTDAKTNKQQQQAAASSCEDEKQSDIEEKVYECLKDIDIPQADKAWLTKTHSELIVKRSLAWLCHPTTKINQSKQQALKWACVNNPEIPKTEGDIIQENKNYAIHLESLAKKVPYATFYALNSHAEIAYISGQSEPTCIKYSEKGFNEQLINALRKYGISFNP